MSYIVTISGSDFINLAASTKAPLRSAESNSSPIQGVVLAVTIDNKIQYYGRDGGIGAKGYRAGDPVGKGSYGTLMVKKLKELADDVYVFDLESYRGGTTALKAKRAELKLGKDKFKDHKAWKKANLDRYKQILANRIGTRDQVDAMVAKAVKLTNAAVEEAMEVPKLGRYDQLMTT